MIAADASDEETGRETWHGVVRPGEQTYALGREEGPAPDPAAEKPPVGDQPSVAQREYVPERPEIFRIGREVEKPRTGEAERAVTT